MSIAEKLALIAENEQKVYEAGRTENLNAVLTEQEILIAELYSVLESKSIADAIIERTLAEISSNVTAVGQSAFHSFSSLTKASFPVATSIGQSAFDSCDNLTEVNMPLATSIGSSAFRVCGNLTEVNMPLATSIGSSAFRVCGNLTEVNMPLATSIGSGAFTQCSKLAEVDMPLATSIGSSAFAYCSNLSEVNMPLVTSIGGWAFRSCSKLAEVDMPLVTSIGSSAFAYCSKLAALILRSESMAVLDSEDAFFSTPIASSTVPPITDGTGYIYVPSALVDTYKAGTNWSAYTRQFRALEDYTVDGTITGELDESKI